MHLRPKLSILIPTWNNLSMLQLCLESIERHSELEHQVIVHVNEGTDGTLAWVRDNGIEHTYSPTNIGICRAMNLAAAECRAEYFVYVNDDMFVLPGWDSVLMQAADSIGGDQPAYISGTLVQNTRFSASNVIADYGTGPHSFNERGLLLDFHAGKLRRDDWNGATWPPCCVHRNWWHAVGGYSEDLSPGFYSDVDFSMKLWILGCRRFHGVGTSLTYHFGEQTTSLVRGPRSCKVKQARIQFLRKWGILPSTFLRYFVRAGSPFLDTTPEPYGWQLKWERMRLGVLSTLHNLPSRRAA